MSANGQKRTFALALEKHPDKTFIGRIKRGFDFLGYHFSPVGLAVTKQTIANFIEKTSRFHEQERRTASTASPLEMYVKCWRRWASSGMLNKTGENKIWGLQTACVDPL